MATAQIYVATKFCHAVLKPSLPNDQTAPIGEFFLEIPDSQCDVAGKYFNESTGEFQDTAP